ncbi:MAG: hypothetical protein SPK26_03135, partial [Treponema sp.]|nr:hypothetical protein [Treponema sp.]
TTKSRDRYQGSAARCPVLASRPFLLLLRVEREMLRGMPPETPLEKRGLSSPLCFQFLYVIIPINKELVNRNLIFVMSFSSVFYEFGL